MAPAICINQGSRRAHTITAGRDRNLEGRARGVSASRNRAQSWTGTQKPYCNIKDVMLRDTTFDALRDKLVPTSAFGT